MKDRSPGPDFHTSSPCPVPPLGRSAFALISNWMDHLPVSDRTNCSMAVCVESEPALRVSITIWFEEIKNVPQKRRIARMTPGAINTSILGSEYTTRRLIKALTGNLNPLVRLSRLTRQVELNL